MSNTLLHHFVLSLEAYTVTDSEMVYEPVEQASEGLTKLVLTLPNIFEFP